MERYNNEAENLEVLSEECGEIIEIMLTLLKIQQVKTKIIRFGLEDCHPDMPGVTNRQRLEQEIGHFNAMVQVLVANGTISESGIEAGEVHKLGKLPNWYGKIPRFMGGSLSMANLQTVILRNAPHGRDCRPEEGKPCTCWKATALRICRGI